ncbi:MAG: MFS transporter [Rhodobacteraceae bacterium]|nr:MFS transporter [Paracoccaceae bacterium]
MRAATPPAPAAPGCPALAFILITLAVDAMGIGLIVPVMPALIGDVTGGSLADAALWGGILTTAFAAMQFLFGPVVGSLSDAWGRRPVLLVSLAVMALDYLVMALAGSVWLLLAGRVVGGITAATQTTATAFIADISPPERKAANFGLVGAAFGAGFILGPLAGGLIGELGPRAPFLAAAALAAANLALGWAVLPETVTDAIRRPFSRARANPFGAFRAIGRLPGAARLVVVFFLYEFAFVVYPATWSFFTIARFGWTPATVGLSLAVFGVTFAAVQGGLIRPVLRLLGERGAIGYGLVVNCAVFVWLAVVRDGTLALLLTPLCALGAVVTPAVLGLLSRGAPPHPPGAGQGGVAAARGGGRVAAPPGMSRGIHALAGPDAPLPLPGAAFLLSAALMVACGLVLVARPRAPARS